MGWGGPEKILLEVNGFSQGPTQVRGAVVWGRGLGAPMGPGSCRLRGCCGCSTMGVAVVTPQEGTVMGGHGSGCHSGVWKGQEVICNVRGGSGSRMAVSPALTLPAVEGMGRGHGVDEEEEQG